MFVLFALFISAQGSVAVTTQEFSSYQACNAAKTTIEATAPSNLNYSNYHALSCVAK